MLRRRQTWDTRGWFLQEPLVVSWMKPLLESRILWYNAPLRGGKSVLSAFIIHHLRNLGLVCQIFLFRYSDHSKRSVVGSLLALASRLARTLPEFGRLLDKYSPETLGNKAEDPLVIWHILFKKPLFKTGRTDKSSRGHNQQDIEPW